MNFSASQENYLKIIWHLQQNRRRATAKVVADELNIKPPTVLAMFRQLQKRNLLTYNKTEGALLTDAGADAARKLVRKHRLIETFLGHVLGMDEQQIHEEAERLEHVISDQLMYRIDHYLGFPGTDPHGSVIPPWSLQNTIALGDVAVGRSFVVNALTLEDEKERYYAERDLVKGALWTMIEKPPGEQVCLLGNGKKFLALSLETAARIKVRVQA
ncbi:MAG: metal-dependent transcriptional regulator [Calditrichaeota bacterium]|nr:MAG: metal-dependent transcriptional regulator [Calditrichota bacterium]